MEYVIIITAVGLLILAHEAGHLCAALAHRLPVEQFSIGFGPRLWSVRRRETEYRLSAIPIGGYVLPKVHSDEEWLAVPLRSRLAFSLGGPVANGIVALGLLAAAGCLESGLSLTTIILAPLVGFHQLVTHVWAALPAALHHPDQLSGVVGIAAFGGREVGLDSSMLLRFAALLSVNLAIFNLLPVPPLDGGTIVMSLVQRVYRPLGRLRLPLALAGWCALALLFLYTTAMDVYRLV